MPIYGYVYIIGLAVVGVASFGIAGGMVIGMSQSIGVGLMKMAVSGLIIAFVGTALNLFSFLFLER